MPFKDPQGPAARASNTRRHTRYFNTDKGRAAADRYKASDKGVATTRRHSALQQASGYNNANARLRRAERQAYLEKLFWPSADKRILCAGVKRLVVINDLQIPFEDPKAVNEALNVIGRVKPDAVALNGDIVDCVTPETRILTLDLQWIPAGKLTPGTELIGFDEDSPARMSDGRRLTRKLRRSTLEAIQPDIQPVWALTLSNGTVIRSTPGHRWLGWRLAGESKTVEWIRTDEIADRLQGGGRAFVHQPTRAWEREEGYNAGFLEAAFDGEGHITFDSVKQQIGHLGFSQRPGPFLDKVKAILREEGFDYWEAKYPEKVCQILVNGGFWEQARFIGRYRPQRFVDKWVARVPLGRDLNASRPGYSGKVEVVRAQYEGHQQILQIKTSTATYFAEGVASHNCYRESAFLQDWRIAKDVTEEQHLRARAFMKALADIPKRWWVGGNHEERWWRVVKDMKVRNLSDRAAPVVANLLAYIKHQGPDAEIRVNDPIQSFARLFDMPKHGFTYYPYSHRLYFAERNLVVCHGKYVSRHAGYAAKRTYEWLGRSCIVGHTHRRGHYSLTSDGREHGAWENACLCQLEPEYDDSPNWQQGLCVVEIDGPTFHVVPVPIVRSSPKANPRAVLEGL